MKTIYLRSLFAVALLCALLTAPLLKGATIVEVSGNNDSNYGITFVGFNLLVSFSTAVDYANVSIEVSLLPDGQIGASNVVTAYLTNQVGPGTTLANEIASSSTLISTPVTPYTVFSGLNLAAGDYNLILSGPFEVLWFSEQDPFATVVENDGASVTRHFAYGFPADAYVPASVFTDETNGHNLLFKVTGDRVPVSGVPEPSTLVLFGIGAMALATMGRRRARRS